MKNFRLFADSFVRQTLYYFEHLYAFYILILSISTDVCVQKTKCDLP